MIPGKTFLGLEELQHEGTLWRCLIAEFLGTMLLVTIATGGCTLWDGIAHSPAQVAFVNGFTVTALISVGFVSNNILWRKSVKQKSGSVIFVLMNTERFYFYDFWVVFRVLSVFRLETYKSLQNMKK